MLTRQGWVVAGLGVAFLVAGRLLGLPEFFQVGAALLGLVAVGVAYVRSLRLTIAVERELHPPRVHAGTPSRVDLRVENQATRRTPVLGLTDQVAGTTGANLMVGPLAPGAVVRAAYRLPTDRRGLLAIGPLDVTLTDPFGLSRVTLRASGVSDLTVYPRVDDIVPTPQTAGNDPLAGAEHPNTLGRTGEDFYALRNYVVGDDLRRVHWPSTARHDELMVRQDELPWQGRATLLVDVRRATTAPAALELVISAAASIINASARRQDLLRLFTTDGADSGFAAGHAHIDGIMEHLASVEASEEGSLDAVVGRLARSSTGGALIVIVADISVEERDQLLRLRKRFGSVAVVQFDSSAWDPSVTARPPTFSRNGVLHITGSHPFDVVWNSTMRPKRVSARQNIRRVVSVVENEPEDDRWYKRTRLRP